MSHRTPTAPSRIAVTADIHGDAASLTPSSISSASAARSRSCLARQKTPVGLVGHTHRPAIAYCDLDVHVAAWQAA
jgi:hypothetical protein